MSENVTGSADATEATEIGPGLYLIPGHHPASMWTDVNEPNIMALHAGRELYLLDTGLGPAQRQAIVNLASRLGGQFDRVTLLNSHGHADHMGNNDVLADLGAASTRHFISEKSTPYFDTLNFFRDAYNEGGKYFDYVSGLDLSTDALMPLLTRAGLDPDTDPAQLAALGKDLAGLGLTSVISHFMGDLMMRNISETYPPIHISVGDATFYESSAPQAFRYGEAEWRGWQIGDVCVFQAHGHTPDGVLFYLPEHRFLFFADETTTIPIWGDTSPGNAARNLGRVLAMVDAGAVDAIAAGHFPLEVITGADNIRATVNGFLAQKNGFESCVHGGLAAFPGTVTIDQLYEHLSTHRGRMTEALLAMQFPKMPTFFKLTLLNYCREHLTETRDQAGRRAFTAASR
jgi:glyoxylase-like metal-dependent hydrolase (beta-lactamase superfamily II)